nr:hypothetical protein CFP56_63565 [Quercus suber]
MSERPSCFLKLALFSWLSDAGMKKSEAVRTVLPDDGMTVRELVDKSGFCAVQAGIKLVFRAARNVDVHELLEGFPVIRAAGFRVADQAVGPIGSLSGAGLGEGNFACARNDRKAAGVTDIELGASNFRAICVEEGRVHIGGKGRGAEKAAERNNLRRELHGCCSDWGLYQV